MDIYELLNIALMLFLVVTAITIAVTRNLLAVSIMLGIFSLLMALMYLTLGAPDVAITEAAIGAGISTILVIASLLLTGAEEGESHHNRFISLGIILFTGAALIYATTGMPVFGDPNAITNNHLIPHYLETSGDEMGIPNIVTSILASYRGFDTLGETFVVFTAAMSILLLIGGKRDNEEKK